MQNSAHTGLHGAQCRNCPDTAVFQLWYVPSIIQHWTRYDGRVCVSHLCFSLSSCPLAVCDTLLTIAFTVYLNPANIPEADTRTFRRLLAKACRLSRHI